MPGGTQDIYAVNVKDHEATVQWLAPYPPETICSIDGGNNKNWFAYLMTVTTEGTGNGTVISTPPGIACSPTCNADFPGGTDVTLTATPDGTSALVGWGGDCIGAGENPTCTVTMDRARSATARFDLLITYYRDADGDTYGDPENSVRATSPPAGYVTDNSDCNDSNASIHPGALEVCNSIDDNCNGQADEGFTLSAFYNDADSDTYGNPSDGVLACSQPPGRVPDDTDCNDSDPAIHPGATEIPNDGIDQDCSGRDLITEVPISNAPSGDQRFPWADYNEATGEYLVLWQDKRNVLFDDIYGVRLDVNGNRIGSDFPVSTAAGHQQRVLVKSGGGGYLALWHDLRNQAIQGADIYGAWIDGAGNVGPEMAICACPADQWNVVAGYDPVSNSFLVVWLDARGSTNNQTGNPNDDYDLYGVVIPAGGSTSLTPFPVMVVNNGQRGPQIGYDYGNSRYYLAWNDRRNGTDYDLYGARVETSGVSLDGMGILLSSAVGNQFRPTVTDRRPTAGIDNHIIAWTDFRNGAKADVYGAYIDGNGAVVGRDFSICADPGDEANVVADVDWINTKKDVVSWIRQQDPQTYYNVATGTVDQVGSVTCGGPLNPVSDEQRANVVTYSTDGITDYGFLEVSADRRNGTDYDIWGMKVFP
jgi:hypothetical protein